jgi:hypothetical protein
MSWYKKLKNLIDIHGHQFNLNIKGEKYYSTTPSFILSIISLIFAIVSTTNIVRFYFSEFSMTLSYNQEERQIPVNDLSNMPILFSLRSLSGSSIPPGDLFHFHARYVEINSINDTSTGKLKTAFKTKSLAVEQCNRKNHLHGYNDLFEDIDVESYFCLSKKNYNLTLYGVSGDVIKGYSVLSIYAIKCDLNNTNCNRTLTESVLKNSVFRILHLTHYIDRYNKTYPNKPKIQIGTYSNGPEIIKKHNIYFEESYYTTDTGVIFQRLNTNKFSKYSHYILDVEMPGKLSFFGDDYYGNINFINSQVVSYYSRVYMKLQFIFANIGGIVVLTNFGFKAVTSFMTKNFIIRDIANAVFDFSGETSQYRLEDSSKHEINFQHHLKKNNHGIHNDVPKNLVIIKKKPKSKNIKLSFFELLCCRFCMKSNKKIKTIERLGHFINNNLSVEYILRQFYNLEQMISNLDNHNLKNELEKDSLILYKRSESEKNYFPNTKK